MAHAPAGVAYHAFSWLRILHRITHIANVKILYDNKSLVLLDEEHYSFAGCSEAYNSCQPRKIAPTSGILEQMKKTTTVDKICPTWQASEAAEVSETIHHSECCQPNGCTSTLTGGQGLVE